ncbi:MAG: HupE/UreJ family protein [Myxococcaceae bacterium]|nr:MAG: HupE/UreJ family protein [Myxococcaceae bacterium]
MAAHRLLVLFVLCALAPGVARAHALRLSTGEVTIDGRRVQAVLQFARAELDVLRPEEIPATVQVSSDGAPCVLAGSSVAPVQEDGVAVTARWDCPRSPGRLRMALGFLGRLPEGHLHVALVRSPGATVQRTARASAPVLEVEAQPGAWAGAGRFLRLGAEHIFQGADHIAFLLGVLLLGGSFRQLVGIVTAFTVAHSLTLGLATVGWVVPPPRLVEPLIALSIVAVAVENLLSLRPPLSAERVRVAIAHRWRLTFAFGLVHGFGFAAALRALELPRALLAPSLLTFNVGVELGQLVIVALAWPVLRWLRGVGRVWPAGIRWASAAVAGLGVYWLVDRVVSG